jgi:transposase-like protein
MIKVRDANGRVHVVPEGTDTTMLGRTAKAKYPCTQKIKDKICQRYMEGHTVRKIADEIGIPYGTIVRWIRVYPDFRHQMLSARESRGLYHEEEAIRHAEEADEDNVQSARLKVETHKWAAEKADPKTYGKVKDTEGTGNVQIIINTGVPLPEPIEVKAEEVK